ncbi:MAG: hypothetical protein ACK55I_35200, partial [bacterium]
MRPRGHRRPWQDARPGPGVGAHRAPWRPHRGHRRARRRRGAGAHARPRGRGVAAARDGRRNRRARRAPRPRDGVPVAHGKEPARMRQVLAIAQKDLRLLLRDKGEVFFTFVFPVILAVFFGFVFGGNSGNSRIELALVVESDARIAQGLA